MYLKTLILSIILCPALLAQGKWELQYFFDEDKSTLLFTDLQFVSPQRGIACGVQVENGKPKGVVVVTSDGGKNWSKEFVKELPVALFFLDETAGWMITDEGIWFTEEAGRSWTRLHKREGLLRLHFIDRQRGWAVGHDKMILETTDGGKTWKKTPEADRPQTEARYTSYDWIDFATPRLGMIVGKSQPPRRVTSWRGPIWTDPNPEMRNEWPSLTLILETKDSGKTWVPKGASIFGRISRVRFGKGTNPVGLGLIEFENFFSYPSDLMVLEVGTGKSYRTLRRKDRAITDMAVLPDGGALAVGWEPPGALPQSPIPGKVRVMYSSDLQAWSDMQVDYRAVANRVYVSAIDGRNAWIATDGGMILHWNAAAK